MFTLDATIDAVQTGKKAFVNTFVTNEAVKSALLNFVDAQSEYTKKAVKAGSDAATLVTQEMIKSSRELAQFDYNKFAETLQKAFQIKK